MSFRNYADKLMYEEKVSSKLMKNAIDILNDFVYYVKGDLSNDERKQIVDNLEVSVDGVEGNSVKLNGVAEFVKNAKYNKKVVFSVELKFDGIQDGSGEDGTGEDMDSDVEGGEDLGIDDEAGEELPDDAGEEEEIPESVQFTKDGILAEVSKVIDEATESNSVERSVRTGNGFKERLVVKSFKTSDAMYKFLGTGSNSMDWKESNKGLKAGTYVFAGGEWRNIKSIDPSALAHM